MGSGDVEQYIEIFRLNINDYYEFLEAHKIYIHKLKKAYEKT